MIEVYAGVFILILCVIIIMRRCYNTVTVPRKKLLVLDINNILVTRAYSLKEDDLEIWPMAHDYIDQADMLGNHYTWKRPDLDEFLNYCLDNFTVSVWSSAWPANVDRLCEYIFTPMRFINNSVINPKHVNIGNGILQSHTNHFSELLVFDFFVSA